MTDGEREYRPVYGWLVVALAVLAYVLSNVDRQLISVLIVPIERDLGLSDTEFGALQGLAYSLFYAIACVPIATLSDRFSRSMIMTVGLTLWSAATIACGMVTGFWSFFVARALVGIEESSLLPAVYSLVGDLFPREKLGRAMGTFFLAPFIGATLAFMLGGYTFHHFGETGTYVLFGYPFRTWQLAFLIAGAPGFVLAAIIALIVRDPRTRAERQGRKIVLPPFREVLSYLGRERGVFVPVLLGFPLLAIPLYVTLAWSSAYLVRMQGFTSAQAGVWLGSTSLIAGCGGTLIAGLVTDLLVSRQRRAAPFELAAVAAIILALIMLVALVAPFPGAPFVVIASSIFLGCFSLAPSAAVIQTVAPSHYRSRVSAVFLIVSLLWQTLGNVMVGVLNDRVFQGTKAIGISVPLFVLISASAAALVFLTGRRALVDAALRRDEAARAIG